MQEVYRQYLQEGEAAAAHYALASPRRLPLGIAGSRIGNRAGSSLEFKEHREYELGDDLRRIDWSAFARSEKLIIKLYQEEVSPHLDVVIDGSSSMALSGSAKTRAVLGIAATLATAATNAGYSHTAWLTQGECRRIDNSQARPQLWENIQFDYPGSPLGSLSQMRPRWHPQGIRVLISDLLWMGDPLSTLAYFKEKATAVIILQVLAQADITPPEHGNLQLIDSETGEMREIFIDTAAQRRYSDAFQRHQQNWHMAARHSGSVLLPLVAEKLVNGWQLEELVAAEVLKI